MKRKLISVMLSAFAVFLLMGAAANTDSAAALLAEEESPVSQETQLETEAQLPDEIPGNQEADAPEDSEAGE